MKVVEQIKLPISDEMELFEQKFSRLSMSSKVALLNRITHYIVNRKGKQMRPMFVFLVAKMLNNGRSQAIVLIEVQLLSNLFIQQVLVHDDVVDDSVIADEVSFLSMHLWKNKIAVLSRGLSII